MKIDALREHWDDLASRDAMWAILTEDAKKGGKWSEAEFFALGEREIASVIGAVESATGLSQFQRGLDFGCGVGRLTQALARYCAEATGVDISQSMVAQARKWNRHGDRVQYVVNTDADLRQFEDGRFDLIYSNIVLQHVAPEYAQRYMKEFFRVLSPGGVAVFQIPEKPRWTLIGTMLRVLPMWLIRLVRKMDMYGMTESEVLALGQSAGGRIVEVREDNEAGPHWVSKRYMFQKV
jgi:SAM-dependent methyltransferase